MSTLLTHSLELVQPPLIPMPDPTLGRGFNTFTGKLCGTGITAGRIENIRRGQDVDFKIVRIESVRDLKKELGIHFDLDVPFRAFGGIQARMGLVSESHFNQYSSFLLIQVSVSDSFDELLEYQANAAFLQSLQQGNYDDLLRKYGNEFVQTIVRGGELYALLEFSSENQQRKRELDAALQASVGIFKAQAEFEQKLNSLSAYSTEKIKIGLVTDHIGQIPVEGSRLMEFATRFPEHVRQHPATIRIETASYATVSNVPVFPSFIQKMRTLNTLLEKADEGRLLVNNSQYILNKPQPFALSAISSEQLRGQLAVVRGRVAQVETAIATLQENPFSATVADAVSFTDIVLPAQRFSTALSLEVMVHVQNRGDVTGHHAEWVPVREVNKRIEGFAIRLTNADNGMGIEYQARLKGRGETPPAQNGSFCGTRGEARKLLAFRIQLTGTHNGTHQVYYQALLNGDQETKICKNGEYCETFRNHRIESIKVWIE